MKTVEIWIAMDSDGDFAISHEDPECAVYNYNEDYGDHLPVRVVKVTVHMDPPQEVVDAGEVTVPAEAGQIVEASAS